MKSMFEYAGSLVIMLIVTFVFTSFIYIEIQEVSARNYHTKVVERIQNDSNYFEQDLDEYENIELSLTSDNLMLVVYHYQLNIPIFGRIFNQTITGYAR